MASTNCRTCPIPTLSFKHDVRYHCPYCEASLRVTCDVKLERPGEFRLHSSLHEPILLSSSLLKTDSHLLSSSFAGAFRPASEIRPIKLSPALASPSQPASPHFRTPGAERLFGVLDDDEDDVLHVIINRRGEARRKGLTIDTTSGRRTTYTERTEPEGGSGLITVLLIAVVIMFVLLMVNPA